MAQDLSTSITRRSLVAGLALSAAPLALVGADNAYAQAKETTKETTSEKSLYERLGGVFAIAAVVDHFSDAVVKNPVVGQKSKNPQLREWHTKNLKRLPGLKFLRWSPRIRDHKQNPAFVRRLAKPGIATGTEATARETPDSVKNWPDGRKREATARPLYGCLGHPKLGHLREKFKDEPPNVLRGW